MKFLQKIRSLLGYGWAVLCLIIIPATFIGLGVWPQALAKVTGAKVSPWYSGGEVARTIDHGSYRTLLRKPVFDGLFAQRSEGFVQIDWVPGEHQNLPATIDEEFDLDADGNVDARIHVDTRTGITQLTPLKTWVLRTDNLIIADQERILRIRLRNPGHTR